MGMKRAASYAGVTLPLAGRILGSCGPGRYRKLGSLKTLRAVMPAVRSSANGGQKMPINRLLKIGATSGDPMKISEVAVNQFASRSSPRSCWARPCPAATTEATAKGTSESDFDLMMHSLFYDLASPTTARMRKKGPCWKRQERVNSAIERSPPAIHELSIRERVRTLQLGH